MRIKEGKHFSTYIVISSDLIKYGILKEGHSWFIFLKMCSILMSSIVKLLLLKEYSNSK